MTISVRLRSERYNIELGNGILSKAGELLNLNRKVLIVTDSGVPEEYSATVARQCSQPFIITVLQGELSKSFENYMLILKSLSDNGFTRSDCVVAVGGGVIGDMAGFAAATYMRGIDFYNIPTTLLSQVDSSIGGKTAIDFCGYKNIVGAFYQPKCVLIDPDTLKTLPERQLNNGLVESIKMAMTYDRELFELIESGNINENINEIIRRSLLIKKYVVEQDEKETGLRKTLNFGHTVGHAIESVSGMEKYYHGECVAMGMLLFTANEPKVRLEKLLETLNLPTKCDACSQEIINACLHDKKKSGDIISVVTVEKIGEYALENITVEQLSQRIREVLSK